VGTYSHHYAYSAHVKAAARMPRSSGVVFIATHHFPNVGWYDIDSCLEYSCPAVLPPCVDRLATLTGTLCGRMQGRRVQHNQTEVLGEPTEGPLE